MSDEVNAKLNPEPDDSAPVDQPTTLPRRPADSASKAKWIEYLVALGADPTFLTEDTEHFDARVGESVVEPPLDREQLIELADRLGG